MHVQLLPYLRTASADVAVALQRVERVTRTIPAAWFAARATKSTEPLLSLLQGLARHVEADKASAANRKHAQALQQPLRKLGGEQTAQRLAAAFKP